MSIQNYIRQGNNELQRVTTRRFRHAWTVLLLAPLIRAFFGRCEARVRVATIKLQCQYLHCKIICIWSVEVYRLKIKMCDDLECFLREIKLIEVLPYLQGKW